MFIGVSFALRRETGSLSGVLTQATMYFSTQD